MSAAQQRLYDILRADCYPPTQALVVSTEIWEAIRREAANEVEDAVHLDPDCRTEFQAGMLYAAAVIKGGSLR